MEEQHSATMSEIAELRALFVSKPNGIPVDANALSSLIALKQSEGDCMSGS